LLPALLSKVVLACGAKKNELGVDKLIRGVDIWTVSILHVGIETRLVISRAFVWTTSGLDASRIPRIRVSVSRRGGAQTDTSARRQLDCAKFLLA
jgi:hypothetical protein